LAWMLKKSAFGNVSFQGMGLNVLTGQWILKSDQKINYFARATVS